MSAVVLCVRDPDYDNDFIIEGDVEVIDIDLGRSFNGKPDNLDQWRDWSESVLGRVAHLPADSNIRTTVEKLVKELRPQ